MSSAERFDVAVFLSTLASVRGGLETTAVTLTRGLAERGHNVTLVAGGWRALPVDLRELPARWVLVPYLSARAQPWNRLPVSGMPFRLQSTSFNLACRVHPEAREVLHGAAVSMSFLPRETAWVSRARATQGRAHLSYFPGGGLRWLRCDSSTVRLVNPAVALRERDALAAFPVDGVFRSGVPRHWLAANYDVRRDARTLLFVGRLEKNKGVVELVEIFRNLSATLPGLQLRIAGDGPLRGAISAAVQRASLHKVVHLLGALSQEQVHTEMASADLLLFPTHFENLPLTLLEASASGLPFLASDIEGIRGFYSPDSVLVSPGDTKAWVRSALDLLQDYDRRRSISASGRRFAAEYIWDSVVEEIEAHLAVAVERSRSTRVF